MNEINIISPNFTPKNVFKITYDKVKVNYYGLISFQIILSTDGKISFVSLKYSECLSFATLISPPGINCVNLKGQSVKIPIGDPCLSSNVNIKGTWIFDVTEECKYFSINNEVLLFNFLILKLLFIKGLQNIIPEGNDNFEIVPIGFDFLFFNRIYKNVTISTNGFILFNSTSRCCTTSSIPKLSNVITAFHYDIDSMIFIIQVIYFYFTLNL